MSCEDLEMMHTNRNRNIIGELTVYITIGITNVILIVSYIGSVNVAKRIL